ncbi:VEX1 protein, partial [Catharus fuscescens]|nr:VEX1 protein [Catharus fuscescens]
MEKGPFSVEWLAQSSRGGGAREMPGECRPSPLQTPPSVPAESPRDREAAERRSAGHEAGSEGSGRSRTKFSAAQLQELERSFREQRYIGAGEKRRLAAVLNLSQSQIKTWFQNRRMKFKRQTQDAR